MNTINNEEHINNIKEMIDGIIPRKYTKNYFKSLYKVHKYNYICSEVNSLNSNELEYMIIFYTTKLNSTNRQNVVKLFTNIIVSLFTTLVTIYVAILPNLDVNSTFIIFNELTNNIILFMILTIAAIFCNTIFYDKKMKKYEYILSILQNEQTRRTKPQTNRQQQKRNQRNRNKNNKK